MAFKVRVKVDASKVKKKVNSFVQDALKTMAKEIRPEILKEIEGGRPPVKGLKRYQGYSKSYIDAIEGKATFRTNKLTKGVFKITDPDKVWDYTEKFRLYGKRKRPVNLKVTGQLLASLKAESNKSDVKIWFDDELFDIHNNKGAGKSKTIRRMLPTKQGETFSRSITLRIREIVGDLAKKYFGWIPNKES